MHHVRIANRRGTAARNLLIVAVALVIAAVVGVLLMKPSGAPVASPAPASMGSGDTGGGVSAVTPEDSGAAAVDAVDSARVAENAADVAATPAPKPTPSGPVDEFTGRVVSTEGKTPVPGARVSLAQATDSWFDMMTSVPKEVASTVTDADGSYRLEHGARMVSGINLSMITVEAEGLARETAVAYSRVLGRKETVDFELEKGARVAGWVIDTDDHPVAGALVGSMMLEEPDQSAMGGEVQRYHSGWATTGGNGGFEIGMVPAGAKLQFPARAAGYVTAMSDEVDAGAVDVRIVMSKGGASILGQVLDADEKPVADIRVVASINESGASVGRMRTMFASMTGSKSDSSGKFRFDNLAAGAWNVQAVEMKEGGRQGRMAMQQAQLGAEGEVPVTLRFEKPVTVVGRAIDAATKEGIAGIRVGDEPYSASRSDGTKEDQQSGTRKEAVTGLDGTFRVELPGTSYGNQWLYYKVPDGWIPDMKNAPGGDGMHYLQGAQGGSEVKVELVFRKGVVLAGRVTDGQGAPASGATVRTTAEALMNAPVRSAQTDSNGEFSISVEPASMQKILATSKAGWASAKIDVPSQGDPAKLEIVLQANGGVSGKVTADGKPLAGAGVTLSHRFGNTTWPGGAGTTRTDATGAYLYQDVAGGTVVVSAEAPAGTEYAVPKPQEFELAAAEERTGVDFALGEGDAIEGVVSDGEGKPIEGAVVMWHIYDSMPQRQNQVKTDKEGYYRIAGLRENAVINYMNVTHPGYDSAYRQNVTVLDGPQNFTLKRDVEITLLAVDAASGKPVGRYEYFVGDPGDGIRPTRVANPEGKSTLSIGLVGEGTQVRVYVAEIGEDGKPTGRKGSSAFSGGKAGEPVEVTVQVGGGTYEVSGTVLMQGTDEPVADALVGVFKQANSPFGNPVDPPQTSFDVEPARTDSKGKFKLEGLLEGSYRLSATKEGLVPVDQARVTIAAGAEVEDAVIRMAAYGVVFGQAIDRERRPLAAASLEWYEQNPWRQRSTTTDEDGRYRIEGLKPENISLALNDSRSGLRESRSVKVEAGVETEQNFDFSDTIKLTGRITVNGEAWTGQGFYFYMNPVAGAAGATVMPKGAGAYEAYPRAGNWKLGMNTNGGGIGVASRFALEAEPREQTMDFNVATVPADLVVEVPEGTSFSNGYTRTRVSAGGSEEDGGMHLQMEIPRKHMPAMLPNRYKATFSSYDGALSGESEWTDIAAGGDNVIVIFATNVAEQREALKSVQEKLRDLGFDPGPIDGIMGPLTSGALRRFQEANGLPATGEADAATKAKLDELSGGS